jgi:hypothetical protein
MQHCKRAGVPIICNQDTYTAAGKGHIWETQVPFGYHTGIAFALQSAWRAPLCHWCRS